MAVLTPADFPGRFHPVLRSLLDRTSIDDVKHLNQSFCTNVNQEDKAGDRRYVQCTGSTALLRVRAARPIGTMAGTIRSPSMAPQSPSTFDHSSRIFSRQCDTSHLDLYHQPCLDLLPHRRASSLLLQEPFRTAGPCLHVKS